MLRELGWRCGGNGVVVGLRASGTLLCPLALTTVSPVPTVNINAGLVSDYQRHRDYQGCTNAERATKLVSKLIGGAGLSVCPLPLQCRHLPS